MDSGGTGSGQLLSGMEDSAGDAAVLRMRLGGQLRRFREAAGITPEEAGFEIRGSRSKISRLENGRVKLKNRDVTDLLTLYGVHDQAVRSKFLALAMQSNERDWWAEYGDILPGWLETYLGLEAAATIIRGFEVQFVHGLFQTADYARVVAGIERKTPPEEEERWVSMLLRRQELLGRPDSPSVWSVMDEAVLRRPVGGAAVMRAQFRHLIKVAELPQVTLQVIPFARGAHAGGNGSFTVLRFEERDLPDVVYLEQLTNAVYLEQRPYVERYLEVADEISSQALTPDETVRLIEQAARDT